MQFEVEVYCSDIGEWVVTAVEPRGHGHGPHRAGSDWPG